MPSSHPQCDAFAYKTLAGRSLPYSFTLFCSLQLRRQDNEFMSSTLRAPKFSTTRPMVAGPVRLLISETKTAQPGSHGVLDGNSKITNAKTDGVSCRSTFEKVSNGCTTRYMVCFSGSLKSLTHCLCGVTPRSARKNLSNHRTTRQMMCSLGSPRTHGRLPLVVSRCGAPG